MTRLNYIISLIFLFMCQQDNVYISAKSYSPYRKDLPSESDLENYLKIIARVSQYSSKQKDNIDVHLAFGIFITIVNIKYALKIKETNIPATIRTTMKNIILQNEQLLQHFDTLNADDINKETVQITYLFTNPAIWMKHLKKFTYTHRKKTSLDDLKKTYLPWEQYVQFVNKIEEWKPSPNQSDVCLAALSVNPVNKKESMILCPLTAVCQIAWKDDISNFPYISWCPLFKSCSSMLKEGSNFGYALTHRLLFLVMARHSRGCTMFFETKEEDLSKKLCSMAYDEAQYISLNNYRHADLMLEIMLLCSFDGNSEFLHRSWLRNLQKFQHGGCFSLEASLSKQKEKRIKSDETCNKHITALATGTYSLAVRYIIQEYY